jgi:hypothetical protein
MEKHAPTALARRGHQLRSFRRAERVTPERAAQRQYRGRHAALLDKKGALPILPFP